MRGATQPRIAPLTLEQASPEVRVVLDANAARFGEVLQSLAVTARHPGILEGYLGFEGGLRAAPLLEASLRHLVVLKVATMLGCPYCIDLGSFLGSEAGVTERQLLELGGFADSDAFSAREQLALEYASAMTARQPSIPDDLFDRVHDEFSETEIVELTAHVAWENYRSRFNLALGLQAHGFTANSVCALPEPSQVS